MSSKLVEDSEKRRKIARAAGNVRPIDVIPADAECIEISEDVYKQNNVYRPWGQRKTGKVTAYSDRALDKIG